MSKYKCNKKGYFIMDNCYIKNHKYLFRSLLFVMMDFIFLNISLFLAFYIRYDFRNAFLFMDDFISLVVISTIFKILIFLLFRLYNSLWSYAGIYEVVNVIAASVVANSFLTLFLTLERSFSGVLTAPRSVFVIAGLLDVFAIGGVRISYRLIRRVRKNYKPGVDKGKSKRVAIIGAGSAGVAIAKGMIDRPEENMKPVAFFDVDPSKVGLRVHGIKVSHQGMIKNIVEKRNIDEIVIAIPNTDLAILNQIYTKVSSETGCKIRIQTAITEVVDGQVLVQSVKKVELEDLLGRASIKLNAGEIEQYLFGQIIVVTGAGGSIGSELCRQIARYEPRQLVMLDNYENNLHDLICELKPKFPKIKFETIIANIRDRNRINEIFIKYRPDIVFHAAAHKHVPLMELNPSEAIKNNVMGTWNVAHAADISEVKRFVLISSDKAVNPTNVMGATKRIAELIIQGMDNISKTDFMAVRFGNVLGSSGSVIPLFKRQIESGGPVTVTHQEVTRFFMTIPEASQLVLQAGAFAEGGEIFVLDMGKSVKILDLAENMIRLSGFEPYKDIPIEFTGLRPGEKLYEELLLSEEGMQRTRNDKIFVARPIFTDYALLKMKVERLGQCVIKGMDDDSVKQYVKDLVPTYKRQEQVG